MESKHYSPAEMEAKCIVRFKNLKYMGAGEKKKEGPISPEVYKMLAAPAFAITAPEFDNGPWGEARVKVPDYVNIIAELPPGGGVPLHMHAKTIETFMALSGKLSPADSKTSGPRRPICSCSFPAAPTIWMTSSMRQALAKRSRTNSARPPANMSRRLDSNLPPVSQVHTRT